MMDKDNKEKRFDTPDPSENARPNGNKEQSQPADKPKNTRREPRRGGFDTDFSPRRDGPGFRNPGSPRSNRPNTHPPAPNTAVPNPPAPNAASDQAAPDQAPPEPPRPNRPKGPDASNQPKPKEQPRPLKQQPKPGGAKNHTPNSTAQKHTPRPTATRNMDPIGAARVRFIDKPFETMRLLVLALVFLPLTLYAYWPALSDMAHKWLTNVDYGHGFFVLPLVAFFLYIRTDTYPGTRYGLAWMGLLPILICCLMRYQASHQYLESMEQWSLLFWVVGLVWFFYGHRVFLWALPSLSFMVFMFPLPWRFEILMRQQLQQLAAQLGAGILQILGETAIALGNTVRLSSHELSVADACSGIRFLISIVTIAFAAILLMRRPWWQNVFVLAVAVPLALFVNAARIAMTGILLEHFQGFLEAVTPAEQRISVVADNIAGITMIFVAAALFVGFLLYLGKVFRRVEI